MSDTTERLTMRRFLARYPVRMAVDWAPSNPAMADSERMNHWRCTLRFHGRQMTLIFSMGLALIGEPEVAEVFDCIASDAAGVENAGSFEEWCGEYGYDTDSRKAERIYQACDKQAKALRRLLGDDALYQRLLFETDRL